MRFSVSKLLTSAFLASAVSAAYAITPVYVDLTGDTIGNGADGTQGNPFNNFDDAIATVDVGGEILVSAGSYTLDGVVVDKSVSILGPNATVNPNDGSARNPEAILLPSANDGNGMFSVEASDVTISGFFFEGYIDDGTPDEPIGPDGVNPVGRDYALFIGGDGSAGPFNNVTTSHNIFQNFAQICIYDYTGFYFAGAEGGLIEYNRGINIGIPNVLGQGNLATALSNFITIRNNYVQHSRVGVNVQHTRNPGSGDIIIEDNEFLDIRVIGVVLNGIRGDTQDVRVINNTIDGISTDFGTAGIYAVSIREDTATQRQFTITNNDISEWPAGVSFANSPLERPVQISGGSIDNVSYGAVFVNRLGYAGFFDVVSSTNLTGLSDATGGPATFDPAGAYPLTGDLMLPDAADDATGQTAFANTDFSGMIAVLDVVDPGDCSTIPDLSISVKNAQDAGAIGVLFAETRDCSQSNNASIPSSPSGSAEADNITIPSQMVSKGVGDALKAEIALGTVTIALNELDVPNNTFGVPDPSIITTETDARLVNVEVSNVLNAGFLAFDIPADIFNPQSRTPGRIDGQVSGGSIITGADRGVQIIGDNANFTSDSARYEGNTVGVEIIDGNLTALNSTFADNVEAGIMVSGETASADIRLSNFFGSQPIDVDLSGNPTGFQVLDSNFDADGTAIENRTPADGDVLATGNFWGDVSGPDDDAGVINGAGARISTGVNAADFLPEQAEPVDSDNDGLLDVEEDTNGNGMYDAGTETDPNNPDTDGDTISDGQEVANGTDPLDIDDPNDQAAPDPQFTTDNDGDGVVAAFDPDDTTNDADGDGITDAYEIQRGSDADNGLITPPFGDANSDGMRDNVDALAILEAFLGLRDFRTINISEIDINQDGVVDNVDAIILFNFVLANITYIPFP